VGEIRAVQNKHKLHVCRGSLRVKPPCDVFVYQGPNARQVNTAHRSRSITTHPRVPACSDGEGQCNINFSARHSAFHVPQNPESLSERRFWFNGGQTDFLQYSHRIFVGKLTTLTIWSGARTRAQGTVLHSRPTRRTRLQHMLLSFT